MHAGHRGPAEQAEQRARPAGRRLVARRGHGGQPHEVAEREAQLVGTEPLRLVGEVVEDGLVQARHCREQLRLGERGGRGGRRGGGGFRVDGVVGRRSAPRRGDTHVGRPSGLLGDSPGGQVLGRDDGPQLVRLRGDQAQRRGQGGVPVEVLGELGREEDHLRIRRQVIGERQLDGRVERRLALRDAFPPPRVEQFGHHPAECENGTGRRLLPAPPDGKFTDFGAYPHGSSH
jgi:hypothetical protein